MFTKPGRSLLAEPCTFNVWNRNQVCVDSREDRAPCLQPKGISNISRAISFAGIRCPPLPPLPPTIKLMGRNRNASEIVEANEVVQFGDIARAGHLSGLEGCRMWETDDGMMRKWVLLRKFSSAPPPQVLISSPSKWSHWRERGNEEWDEEVWDAR